MARATALLARTAVSITVLSSCALLCFVAPAHAQEDDEAATARARELFGLGVDAADAEDWPSAAAHFRSALSLRDSPAIRLNLATALVELEERGEAVEQLNRIVHSDAPRRQVRQARAILRDLEPQVGHLTIDLAGDSEGASLRVGGREVPPDRVSVPFAVDPGELVVTAHRDGRELARDAVAVEPGQSASLSLTIVPPVADVAAEAEAPDLGLVEADDDTPVYQEPWLWAAVGGGLLLLVIVVAAATGGDEGAIAGDFEPAVVRF